MKRKTLTLTLCLLVCLSLIGVGFASWIITNTNTKSEEGNIIVDDVTDQRLTVTYEWVPNADGSGTALTAAPDLKYGIKDGVTNAPTWLTNTTTKENLTAYLKITVKNPNGSAHTGANITATLTADAGYETAKTAGLVGALPTLSATEESGGVYILTITLTWGEKFNSKNPAELFAGTAVDDALPSGLFDETYKTCGNYAEKYLTDLNNALTGVKYYLNVTVNRATEVPAA